MSLHCSGYGDLWDDIQNVQENDRDGSVHGVSVSSEEAEGSKEASELERREEYSDWKSEEEELGEEDDNTEDKDEDYKGTTCKKKRWKAAACALVLLLAPAVPAELSGSIQKHQRHTF